MSKILIVVSEFYKDISDSMVELTVERITQNNFDYDKVRVPGAFELASAVNMGLETFEYAGAIVLGCVIKGGTPHFNLVISECARAIQDIAIYFSIPIGFGVLTVNNKQQALDRAKKYAINATNACMEMIKIKEQFMMYNDKRNSRFN